MENQVEHMELRLWPFVGPSLGGTRNEDLKRQGRQGKGEGGGGGGETHSGDEREKIRKGGSWKLFKLMVLTKRVKKEKRFSPSASADDPE